MGFLSYPGSHAVWLPLHDKQPRPPPCGEGHCVPAELEDGTGDEEIQLQLMTSAQIKGKIRSISAAEDCTCSLWFYNEISLLDKAKHAQSCSQVPSIKFKNMHVEFQ